MSEVKTIKRESIIERAIERLTDAPLPSGTAKAPPPREHAPIAEAIGDIPVSQPVPKPAPEVRKISLDLDRLESHGIFSPDRMPNRTTEEFRLIKRAVRLNIQKATEAQSKNPNVLMVTSSHQGEGKSFVALNLAVSLASETDATVLLIDADPTRASIISRLEAESEAESGLLDLLRDDNLRFSDVVLRTNIERLALIPSGKADPLSSELLAGSAAAHLLEEISKRYPDRIVVLDAPPVLATTETAALSLHVGQIVFVVDSRKTTKSAIKESLKLVSACPSIGFVLNRAEFEIGSVRFGSYYGYYKKSYNKYYRPSRKRGRNRQ